MTEHSSTCSTAEFGQNYMENMISQVSQLIRLHENSAPRDPTTTSTNEATTHTSKQASRQFLPNNRCRSGLEDPLGSSETSEPKVPT